MTTSPLANPTATREMLEAFGLATKHRLGQNFLIDNHVIERIMDLAELTGSERVLEVGPGIGTLTLALVQGAGRVTSIEMDSELEPVLSAHAIEHANFNFIMGDALAVPPAQIAEALGGEPELLVANLPYNVAATIILQFFQAMPSLKRAVVMVQKEVADRIAAIAGTKAYGAYTVKFSLYGEVTGRFEVPPRCFMPAPHVDSAVVRIDRVDRLSSLAAGRVDATCGTDAPVSMESSDGIPVCDLSWGREGASVSAPVEAPSAEGIARVVDAAFAQRRKTIRNSMSSNGFDKAALDAAFAQCGIAPTARAEILSTSDFMRLAEALAAASALS